MSAVALTDIRVVASQDAQSHFPDDANLFLTVLSSTQAGYAATERLEPQQLLIWGTEKNIDISDFQRSFYLFVISLQYSDGHVVPLALHVLGQVGRAPVRSSSTIANHLPVSDLDITSSWYITVLSSNDERGLVASGCLSWSLECRTSLRSRDAFASSNLPNDHLGFLTSQVLCGIENVIPAWHPDKSRVLDLIASRVRSEDGGDDDVKQLAFMSENLSLLDQTYMPLPPPLLV